MSMYFFNVATRKLKIKYVAPIIFVLTSAVLRRAKEVMLIVISNIKNSNKM